MVLSVGDMAPDFTAADDWGNPLSLSQFQGRGIVLYFYPKDDMPGCTRQAEGFRDAFGDYEERGIVVLGVSVDGVDTHRAFKDRYGLPFTLMADIEGAIATAYGVEADGYARRVTFFINGAGAIEKVFTPVEAETHAADILSALGG
ncbi:MAG: peroxiredoxin [Cyanobacteria bacterium P01_D01_bin.128]